MKWYRFIYLSLALSYNASLMSGGIEVEGLQESAEAIKQGLVSIGKDAAEITQKAIEQFGKDNIEAANLLKKGMEDTGIHAAQEITQNPITVQLAIDQNSVRYVARFGMGFCVFIGGCALAAYCVKQLCDDEVTKGRIIATTSGIIMAALGAYIALY